MVAVNTSLKVSEGEVWLVARLSEGQSVELALECRGQDPYNPHIVHEKVIGFIDWQSFQSFADSQAHETTALLLHGQQGGIITRSSTGIEKVFLLRTYLGRKNVALPAGTLKSLAQSLQQTLITPNRERWTGVAQN